MDQNDDFPTITAVGYGCSSRGILVLLSLEGIGRAEIALHEAITARRFARAIHRETGHTIKLPDERAFRSWFLTGLRAARMDGGRHVG